MHVLKTLLTFARLFISFYAILFNGISVLPGIYLNIPACTNLTSKSTNFYKGLVIDLATHLWGFRFSAKLYGFSVMWFASSALRLFSLRGSSALLLLLFEDLHPRCFDVLRNLRHVLRITSLSLLSYSHTFVCTSDKYIIILVKS